MLVFWFVSFSYAALNQQRATKQWEIEGEEEDTQNHNGKTKRIGRTNDEDENKN